MHAATPMIFICIVLFFGGIARAVPLSNQELGITNSDTTVTGWTRTQPDKTNGSSPQAACKEATPPALSSSSHGPVLEHGLLSVSAVDPHLERRTTDNYYPLPTSPANEHNMSAETLRVIVTVVGSVGAVIVCIIIAFLYQRKRVSTKKQQKEALQDELVSSFQSHPPDMSATDTSALVHNNSAHEQMTRFHQFASDFCDEEQQLQQQLQQQQQRTSHSQQRPRDGLTTTDPSLQQLHHQFQQMKQQLESSLYSSSTTNAGVRSSTIQSPPPPYQP